MVEVVTVRDLRNRGGEVLDRVERGESVIVTRDGRPVAKLRPLPRRSARRRGPVLLPPVTEVSNRHNFHDQIVSPVRRAAQTATSTLTRSWVTLISGRWL